MQRMADARENDERRQQEEQQHWQELLGFSELNVGGVHPIRTAVLVRQSASESGLGRGLQFRSNVRNVSFEFWKNVKSAFLPEGYPKSVTADYLPFQTWDTLQGISTYIRSMLSTQALLGGIGVGETKATVVGATFQWFLRDFTGMLGGILFTLYQGSNLDSSAKKWRLTADFLNDMAMLMDLISPLFPRSFVAILCIGSVARAITGTASGATRAALTQHFAVRQNAADVQAKEGSQETAATMVGMLVGMVVARATAGDAIAMWLTFLALTAFHMYANYRAVRSLCLTSLNPERTAILLQSFLRQDSVPTPDVMSSKEHVLPKLSLQSVAGLWKRDRRWRISLGSRISSLQPLAGWDSLLPALIHQYGREAYMIAAEGGIIHVFLSRRATVQDSLRGYVHALRLKEALEAGHLFGNTAESSAAESECRDWMNLCYERFLNELQAAGWIVNRIHISASDWRAEWPEQRGDLGKGGGSSVEWMTADLSVRRSLDYKID